MTSETRLPQPEVRGTGHVLYRCATCGQLMEPDEAVLQDGRSFHPDHTPEIDDGR